MLLVIPAEKTRFFQFWEGDKILYYVIFRITFSRNSIENSALLSQFPIRARILLS